MWVVLTALAGFVLYTLNPVFAVYICPQATQRVCLGRSLGNGNWMQLKPRERNEDKNLTHLKLDYTVSRLHYKLNNDSTVCLGRDLSGPMVGKLKFVDCADPGYDTKFHVDENGSIYPNSDPAYCVTLRTCEVGKMGFCDRRNVGEVVKHVNEIKAGAYVYLTKCQPYFKVAQRFMFYDKCVEDCWPDVMRAKNGTATPECDHHCVECGDWYDLCTFTDAPTTTPTAAPTIFFNGSVSTNSPTGKPTSLFNGSISTETPTESPTGTPTESPTGTPTESPTGTPTNAAIAPVRRSKSLFVTSTQTTNASGATWAAVAVFAAVLCIIIVAWGTLYLDKQKRERRRMVVV